MKTSLSQDPEKGFEYTKSSILTQIKEFFNDDKSLFTSCLEGILEKVEQFSNDIFEISNQSADEELETPPSKRQRLSHEPQTNTTNSSISNGLTFSQLWKKCAGDTKPSPMQRMLKQFDNQFQKFIPKGSKIPQQNISTKGIPNGDTGIMLPKEIFLDLGLKYKTLNSLVSLL